MSTALLDAALIASVAPVALGLDRVARRVARHAARPYDWAKDGQR